MTLRCDGLKSKPHSKAATYRGYAWLIIVLLSINAVLASTENFNPINHVRHYEPVYYDHVALRHQHHVTKRTTDTQLEFKFNAFDMNFRTRLKRDASAFHPNVAIETSQGHAPYDVTSVYAGTISDYPSRVVGMVTGSGHFEGRIQVGNETYFLERSIHHFSGPRDYHSVIYRQSDVTFTSPGATCGVQRLYETLSYVPKSTNNKKEAESMTSNTGHNFEDVNVRNQNKYSHGMNGNHRNRREIDPAKVTCELNIEADHLFYQRYYNDTDTVIEKLTQHVQALNNIFPAIDFDGDSTPDNVNFIIKKIKVHTDPTLQDYKYNGNIGVESLLDLHSTDNYDDYCLSYLFTYRDFDGGILGLAWVGDTRDAGGVCETNKEFHGQSKSLNTGVVSILNYNKEVPTAVSHVTFAHEVGHNFGSQHDPDADATCSPGGDSGNYIMYAYATSANQANNDDFSTCSIGYIQPVLEAKARGIHGCFVANTNAICGNRIKEEGEECDCGWDSECTEGCCNPQTDTPGAETPCTRKSTAVCSPSEGTCCDDSCQYRPVAEHFSCRHATSCQEEAFCDGANFNATCPPSTSKANATTCGDRQDFLVCYNGECSGSVCLAHGRKPCFCSSTTPGNTKDEKLCQVCCVDDAGDCRSSYELADIPNATVVAGTPCNNYAGYCDAYKKCRSVNPAGPLSNLKKLFLDGEIVNTVKEFLTKHWYVGVAAALGFVIIIGLVVKFCRKTYKSDDLDLPTTSQPSNMGHNRVQPERY